MRKISFELKTTLILILVFFSTLCLLGPPFFTFDSYDYLHLSLMPKAGGSHSLAFGYILRLLSFLSEIFGKKYYIQILLFWNSLGLALFFSFGINPLRNFFQDKKSIKFKMLVSIIILLLLWPIAGSLIYVSNAFWSEATNILQIALFCILAQYTQKLRLWQSSILALILSAWSYHTRYSEIVLPLCFLGLGIVYLVRTLPKNQVLPNRSLSFRYFILFVFSIVGIVSSSAILKQMYPPDDGKNYVTNLVISASIQCALRCDVSLYKANCETSEGKKIVEESKCSELIFGLKPFGPTVLNPLVSPSEIFRRIGIINTLKWLLLAPFTYLSDTHDIEMGLFQFGDDVLAVKHYPEATQYYSAFLVGPHQLKPTDAFISLAHSMDRYFRINKIFHILTVFSVLLSIWMIFSSTNPLVLFLSFDALGTYLLFSYLNPHVPFRYLAIIIAPAFLAALNHYLLGTDKRLSKTQG